MLQIWNPCLPGWVCSIVFPVGKWWNGSSRGSLPWAHVWNSFGCPCSGTPSWSVTLVSLFRVYSHVIKRLKCMSHSSHYYLDSGEPISICVLGETVIPGCFYITVLVIFSSLGVCTYTSSLTFLSESDLSFVPLFCWLSYIWSLKTSFKLTSVSLCSCWKKPTIKK